MDLTFGVDVSHWQGAIDWPAVEASGRASFAAVRLTIGLGTDDRWQANLAGACDHTEIPMAYAVVGTRADQADAADLLVNLVDRVADIRKVGLVVDAENFSDGSHPTMTQVHAFRDNLKRLTGRLPLAYIPSWWMNQHGYETDSVPWAHWPSRYISPPWDETHLTAARPPLEHGFTVRGPWQFTSSGQVAGIAGNVDRNIFFGTVAELRALALGEETDMPLSAEDLKAVRRVVREELSGFYDTLVNGDATHPVTLRAVLKAAGVTLTDAQVELLGAKLHLAGMPSFEITGQAVPKEPTP